MMRALRALLSGLIIVGLTSTAALAQATAEITGTVKDTSGAVLPGANITATQTDTGFKREAVTDADGVFSLPGLPIGPYRLEVGLQGFKTSIQTGIVLQVNDHPVVPVTLELGTVTEAITVTATTQMVETRALGVSQVMDNKRIVELPLNGRNPADLLALLPAAVPQPALNATSRSMGGSNGGQAFSLAGGPDLRSLLAARWSGSQQPVRQPQSAAAVPRCVAGVPRRNERDDGAERNALRRSGQRSDQVGHECVPRRCLRILPASQHERHRPVRDCRQQCP
jgi:hypothetical protein